MTRPQILEAKLEKTILVFEDAIKLFHRDPSNRPNSASNAELNRAFQEAKDEIMKDHDSVSSVNSIELVSERLQ